ncbi:MAG TPA: hypothetical protein PL009_05590 [Flavipsychrobacter sp.]|nr:hypothetical protein [Flavipsychrobacter sp.]
MERISTLLEKIKELNASPSPTLIEVDLMMDYSRVLYADLFEWRKKLAFNDAVAIKPVVNEPFAPKNTPATSYQNYQVDMDKAAPDLPVKSVNLSGISYENTKPPTDYTEPRFATSDIRRMVGINDKYQYISELFGNNPGTYDEVINELNAFDNEEEAIVWLNNTVSNQFDWQEDSDAVQSFYKLLSDYYGSR